MPRQLVLLRCAVCDLWLAEFPRHLRGTGRADLLCVDCILWFAAAMGLDPNVILEEMGIPLHPPEEVPECPPGV